MPSKDIYFYTHFAPEVRIHLESGAFRALCKHLNDRSDSVQNIDLMIVGGFGRNCLAKWLVKEARNLSANSEHPNPKDAALLDAFGHSQATREVYGCDFFRWKKKYPQKTSFEQMQKYQESESIHAVHKEDKMLKSGMTVAMTQDFEQKFKMSLEAGAFRSLLEHLSDRSDIVQNIELMTISGFCRNCLAKWLVVEARNLSSTIKGVCQESFTDEENQLVTDLDAFGYDEAGKYVYGIDYAQWKAEHAKKTTDKQLSMYKASAPIHAKHDKKTLEPQCKKGPASYAAPSDEPRKEGQTYVTPVVWKSRSPAAAPAKRTTSRSAPQSKKPSILSDVCCEDVDNAPSMDRNTVLPRYRTPSPPKVDLFLRVGILTVSDRAANGEYENGDLSGPAVEQSLNENITKLNAMRGELDETKAKISFCVKSIVPDEFEDIAYYLNQWCGSDDEGPTCDVIFTTGGTGFSPRDITPEATREIIEKEASGLMTFVTAQCAVIQPLAALSRGVAGICGETLIVNLPGNPAGVGQVLDILVPLLLHAVKDIKGL